MGLGRIKKVVECELETNVGNNSPSKLSYRFLKISLDGGLQPVSRNKPFLTQVGFSVVVFNVNAKK